MHDAPLTPNIHDLYHLSRKGMWHQRSRDEDYSMTQAFAGMCLIAMGAKMTLAAFDKTQGQGRGR